MFELTPQHLAIGGSVALAGVGGLVLLALTVFGVVLLVKRIRARKAGGATTSLAPKAVLPGLLGTVATAANSPLVKEAEKIIVQAIHDSHHAALNAAVAKAFPGLAPFIPAIDQAADFGLAKVSGDPTANGNNLVHEAIQELAKAIQAKQQVK